MAIAGGGAFTSIEVCQHTRAADEIAPNSRALARGLKMRTAAGFGPVNLSPPQKPESPQTAQEYAILVVDRCDERKTGFSEAFGFRNVGSVGVTGTAFCKKHNHLYLERRNNDVMKRRGSIGQAGSVWRGWRKGHLLIAVPPTGAKRAPPVRSGALARSR